LASYPALDIRYDPGPGTALLHELLYAELDAFEPLAIHDLETADGWRVFFRLTSQRDGAQAAVMSALGDRLAGVTPTDVDDEDWARRSQAALKAVQVGRVIVAPPWDLPVTRDGATSPSGPSDNPGGTTADHAIVIEIEPSMGFGTGHHATTRLCLDLLQTLDLSRKLVVDVGTGSGVLALAALRLGAAAVTAIDNDPDALQNARENFSRNHAANEITVLQADLSDTSSLQADVVLANLTGAVLQRFASALRRIVSSAGVLIVSGFSPDEVDEVAGALAFDVTRRKREGEWAALLLSSAR
jgi:ribosomal protein L11 methyltransferase